MPATSTFFVLLGFFVLALALFWGIQFSQKLNISKILIRAAKPFEINSTDYRMSMLVLGDSTAVGVGADNPEDSVPALVARRIGATYVENHALGGARTGDLQKQIQDIKREHYDFILVHIGGNDIIRFERSVKASARLRAALLALHEKSDRIVLLSAGNVGAAAIFPPIVRPFHHMLTRAYHSRFEALSVELGITYVNLYVPPRQDPFVKEPNVYLAEDGLHPSSAGYQLWYERIIQIAKI